MVQFGHGDVRRKKRKTVADSSYQMAQVGHGDGRTARLEKMVATTQLRLAKET